MNETSGNTQNLNPEAAQQTIALSVNVNKIALIRNAREGNNPDLVDFAAQCIEHGAAGITVHPRPDQRHIRPEDCTALASLIKQRQANRPNLEFNIEGNASAGYRASNRTDFNDYPGFLEIVANCLPDQVTLVPDASDQLTSDHGFDLSGENSQLAESIKILKQLGTRVSLFMDPDIDQISRARDLGADRIELYTGPYAQAYAHDNDAARQQFSDHLAAAQHATQCGLGINAGHDLNLDNLKLYRNLPGLLEVSIGHALTIDCLQLGLANAISAYLAALAIAPSTSD